MKTDEKRVRASLYYILWDSPKITYEYLLAFLLRLHAQSPSL